jgi:hypothetical protein
MRRVYGSRHDAWRDAILAVDPTRKLGSAYWTTSSVSAARRRDARVGAVRGALGPADARADGAWTDDVRARRLGLREDAFGHVLFAPVAKHDVARGLGCAASSTGAFSSRGLHRRELPTRRSRPRLGDSARAQPGGARSARCRDVGHRRRHARRIGGSERTGRARRRHASFAPVRCAPRRRHARRGGCAIGACGRGDRGRIPFRPRRDHGRGARDLAAPGSDRSAGACLRVAEGDHVGVAAAELRRGGAPRRPRLEPAMPRGGGLTAWLGPVFGTGPGQGIALLFVCRGLVKGSVALVGARDRKLRALDGVPTPSAG